MPSGREMLSLLQKGEQKNVLNLLTSFRHTDETHKYIRSSSAPKTTSYTFHDMWCISMCFGTSILTVRKHNNNNTSKMEDNSSKSMVYIFLIHE